MPAVFRPVAFWLLKTGVLVLLFAKFPTENVDFIGWLTQKTHFFGIELSNLGGSRVT